MSTLKIPYASIVKGDSNTRSNVSPMQITLSCKVAVKQGN